MRLSEIGENKKEKAELEKEMKITPQSWKIDKLRMIRHIIEFFDKNLMFHTRTKKDIFLTVSNMKFHQKLPTKYLRSLFILLLITLI